VLLAEQIATADVLSGGRMSIGVGSGSTASEFALFGVDEMAPNVRRERFVEVLDLLETAWSGAPFDFRGQHFQIRGAGLLPRPERDMAEALWIGANSPDSADLAGQRGYGLQLSNLRTIPELRELIAAYRQGREASSRELGPERVAASAPLYVATDDARALSDFGPALDNLLRENRRSRPTVDAARAPETPREHLAALRFTVGDPGRCVEELLAVREQLDFTLLNLRPRWIGLTPEQVANSIELFASAVRPQLDRTWSN
jgi:alkanesulfonate monooxygenase SsuD/methylene tetrahydromethanopterin reductase-like flavin-dependent oxidoreductase (luciferase family)